MNYIGIDVAKYHHDAIGLDEVGQVVLSPFRFKNTLVGVQSLMTRLTSLDGPLQIGMESTAHYWMGLYEYLLDQGYQVVVFNPLQIKGYRQVGLRKAKTDRLDSHTIADFLRIRPLEPAIIPPVRRRQLRHLTRFRFKLVDRGAALRRRAHRLLDLVFPEYPALFARPFQGTSRTLLRQAVTADAFWAWPVADLTETIRRASRGRLGEPKALALQAAAQTSLGVKSLHQVAPLEMACLLEQMDLLDQEIKAIDHTLTTLLADEPQYLTTIPGLSTVLAATILAEIGDIQRFQSLKPLLAFAGLDPSVHQSGNFSATRSTLSKRGSPYLRRAIWLAATPARLYNPDLAAFYRRKRQQGKHHNIAMAALAHRLLARIYVVLKQQRPYLVR